LLLGTKWAWEKQYIKLILIPEVSTCAVDMQADILSDKKLRYWQAIVTVATFQKCHIVVLST
jgi:hypothetical protein